MTSVYISCAEHGALYVHRGAGLATTPDLSKLEPLRDGLEPPGLSDLFACPLCRGALDVSVRLDPGEA